MNSNDHNKVNPADYLDQIAPKKKSIIDMKSKFQRVIILACATLLVVIVGSIILNSFSNKKVDNIRNMASKFKLISTVIDESSDNINSSQLKAINSTLSINLTNQIRDIDAILANYSLDIDNLDINSSSRYLLDVLEDARLNAVFDRTYAREVSYELENLINIMKEISRTTDSQATKSSVYNAISNLEPSQISLAEFTAAAS